MLSIHIRRLRCMDPAFGSCSIPGCEGRRPCHVQPRCSAAAPAHCPSPRPPAACSAPSLPPPHHSSCLQTTALELSLVEVGTWCSTADLLPLPSSHSGPCWFLLCILKRSTWRPPTECSLVSSWVPICNSQRVLCAMSKVVHPVGVVLEACKGQSGAFSPGPIRGTLQAPMRSTSLRATLLTAP